MRGGTAPCCSRLGLAILVLPLVSPLDLLGDRYLLSAHMLQHVLIADVAPALILVALRGPLLFFVVPTALLSAAGHTAWLRRFASWLFRPVPVLVVLGARIRRSGTSRPPTTRPPGTRSSTTSSTRAS